MTAVLIGAGLGLIAGLWTARESEKRKAVGGGWPARIFHYLGAASLTGALPAGLASIVLGDGFLQAAVVGIGFMVIGWLALMAYAVYEKAAQG